MAMSDGVETGKGILHEIEHTEYKRLTVEQIREELEKMCLSIKPEKKMSIIVGKGFLEEVYEKHGGMQGLIDFLKFYHVTTTVEGMEYLREVVPEIFKQSKNDRNSNNPQQDS